MNRAKVQLDMVQDKKKLSFLQKQESSHRATFLQLSSEFLSSLENAVSVPSGAVEGPQPRRPLKTSAHFERLLSGPWTLLEPLLRVIK